MMKKFTDSDINFEALDDESKSIASSVRVGAMSYNVHPSDLQFRGDNFIL